MAEIKVVSGKTIIKKITVGVPVRAVKSFSINTSVGALSNVQSAEGAFRHGYMLLYDSTEQMFKAQGLMLNQRLDGGDSFGLDSLPPGTITAPEFFARTN